MRCIRSPKVWIPLVVIGVLIVVPISVLVVRVVLSSPDPLCSKLENADGIIDTGDYPQLQGWIEKQLTRWL